MYRILTLILFFTLTGTASAQHASHSNVFKPFSYPSTFNGYGSRPGFSYNNTTGWNSTIYQAGASHYRNGYVRPNTYRAAPGYISGYGGGYYTGGAGGYYSTPSSVRWYNSYGY